MKIENWINFSKYIVDKGGIFQCILSGGEPLLLGDSLFDIMDILHNDGTGFVLITNGYLMNERIIKRMKKYSFYWVQVSIDGSEPEFHDWFREKDRSWEKAVNAAMMISSAGFPLTIASSVTPQNIEKMDEMANLAYKLGASSIIFSKIMESGRAYKNKNKNIVLNDKQIRMMNDNIKKITKLYNGKMEIKYGLDEVYQLNYHKIYPNSTAIIRPNGDVRLDCIAPFIGGNILENDFYELWNKKMRNAWKNIKVLNYINDLTSESYKERYIVNHVDKDIIL